MTSQAIVNQAFLFSGPY